MKKYYKSLDFLIDQLANNAMRSKDDTEPNFDNEFVAITVILDTIAEYQKDIDTMVEWVQHKHPNITKDRLTKLMLLK